MSQIQYPRTFFIKIVKSKKERKCISCGNTINKGDKYESECTQKDWTENPHYYSTCMKCSGNETPCGADLD